MKSLAERYGPWALVTGASSGIGSEFARRLAADGVNLVLAARRLDRLQDLADELTNANGIEVRPVRADLSIVDGVDAVEKAVADIDLAMAVINAGSAQPGAFLKTEVEDQLDVLSLNVTAPVHLAHVLGERLVDRGRGAVIFTGSTASFYGVPMMANYAATKAFVGTFAEGLNREWGPLGVDVLVVHPGPTRTEMVEMEGVDFHSLPMNWMDPEQVADKALGSLGRKSVLIPGAINKVQRFMFTRLLPRRTASWIWGSLMGRATAEHLR